MGEQEGLTLAAGGGGHVHSLGQVQRRGAGEEESSNAKFVVTVAVVVAVW